MLLGKMGSETLELTAVVAVLVVVRFSCVGLQVFVMRLLSNLSIVLFVFNTERGLTCHHALLMPGLMLMSKL
jgi:hypothetical protein